jgi:hypothetical protein
LSRTLNTMPWEIQKRRRERWRELRGYPGAFGGAWPGRKTWARIRNRRFRRAATVALQMDKDIPKQRHNVAYDIW